MRKHRRQSSILIAFVDLLFTAFLTMGALYLLAFMLIADPARRAGVEVKAEYMLTIEWDNSPDADIDVWVRGPGNTGIINYQRKEGGGVHLDRDALGLTINGYTFVNGVRYVQKLQREVVTWRTLVPGEYSISLYYYNGRDERLNNTTKVVPNNHFAPVTVRVTFMKLNPTVKPVYEDVVTLERKLEEKFLGTWEIRADGETKYIEPLPGESLIKQYYLNGGRP